MNKDVAVSILGQKNKTKLVNKIIKKGFNMIHYDVMDGIFVNNYSLNDEELIYIIKNTHKHVVNIHLMVNNSIEYIEKYLNVADFITFHYEAESIDNIKKIIKKYNHRNTLGIAINPQTNIKEIYEFIPNLNHILIMSVVAGKGGQKFINNTLNKIKILKNYINKNNQKCSIQVDGGINNINGPDVFNAGASNVVSGSYIINNLDIENIKNKILN